MIEKLRARLNALKTMYEEGRLRLRAAHDFLDNCGQAIKDAESAQLILQALVQHIQTQAHEKIARFVSRCLSAVFEDPTTLKIDFVQRRGKTEADLTFIDKDGHEIDPTEGQGIGMLDVAVFASRLANILLAQPQKRLAMILDEPFRHVSRDHDEKLVQMLKSLSEDFGVQFVISTHNENLVVPEWTTIQL